MQQTLQLGQVQPSVLSRVESAVENLKVWWSATSKSFTALCATEKGESFTHGQVVLANLGVAVFLIFLFVAGWLEGGAA